MKKFTINKSKLITNFDQAYKTYDKFALSQNKVALDLIQFIKKDISKYLTKNLCIPNDNTNYHINSIKQDDINHHHMNKINFTDLGAGTGFISQHLLLLINKYKKNYKTNINQKNNNTLVKNLLNKKLSTNTTPYSQCKRNTQILCNLNLIDISHNMLETAKNNINNTITNIQQIKTNAFNQNISLENIAYNKCDLENFIELNKSIKNDHSLNIAISSMSLHWLNDLENFCNHMISNVKLFSFAIPVEGSFKNISRFKFHTKQDVLNYLKYNKNISSYKIKLKKYKLNIHTKFDLIKYFKKIGTGSDLNCKDMHLTQHNWTKNLQKNFKYHVLFVKIKSKNK